jgi:glycosyltransferase involved in cell wall biosynthesis
MKVAVAHNRYISGQPSGENVVVDAEIAQLRAAGVDVVPFLRSSDEIAGLPAVQKALLPLSPLYNGSSARSLAALIKAERPDVLHLHNPYPLLSPWVVRVAHRHGVPVVQTVHNYRHVCAPGVYFRDGHVCRDCLGRTYPLPAVRHACYRGSRAQSAIMATTLAVHRGTWRSVERYLALTGPVAEYLRSWGVPDERITVKPNGVPDPGPPPAEPGTGFLFVGRLSPEKGLGVLLDAWRRHPDGAYGPLRIAGDGEQRALAEQAAAERSDVEYLGHVDRAAIRAAMRAAAVVVMPSLWEEPFGLVAVAALATGRPALVTTVGGAPELVGDAGWAVPPTVDGLAGGLAAAYRPDPGLGALARRRYEENFTEDVNVKRLVDVYTEVGRA